MITDALEKLLTLDDIDKRISFDFEREVVDLNLSDLHLHDTADVNALYDRLEDRIEETGEELWFFLITYSNARIDPAAWVTYARRGKMLKTAHSMGTVRVDACPETVAQIRRSAGTDAYDPNLFTERSKAAAHLAKMPSRRLKKIVHVPNYTVDDFLERVTFLMEEQIMDVDFSNMTIHHSRDVNDFFDFIEASIEKTGRKWFVLVNYNECRIEPAAWVAYARRGQRLNDGGSLGTVRYAVGAENEADIRLRAQTQSARPNIRNTRAEAKARIDEIKRTSGR